MQLHNFDGCGHYFFPFSDSSYYDTFLSGMLQYCLRLFSVSSSHILPLSFPNKRSSTIKSFGCFNSLFKTMNKIDYKIDWQTFEIRIVNKLPLTQVCPSLLMPNQDFKASYWSGILVKHVYGFNMICGRFRRKSLTACILFAPGTRITLNSFNYVAYRKPFSSISSNVHTIQHT